MGTGVYLVPWHLETNACQERGRGACESAASAAAVAVAVFDIHLALLLWLVTHKQSLKSLVKI